MKYREILNEVPHIVSPTDFDLNNVEVNRQFVRDLLKRKSFRMIEEDENKTLFMTGNKINGYVALYLKQFDVLGYLIKYHLKYNILLAATPVTEIVLWRSYSYPHTFGITNHVFFDILLKEWNAIMSDGEQTEDGKKFWQFRLVEASAKNYDIGIMNINDNTVTWWDDSILIGDWIKHNDGWGEDRKYYNIRYVIKNKS